jgi:hypothetical protein
MSIRVHEVGGSGGDRRDQYRRYILRFIPYPHAAAGPTSHLVASRARWPSKEDQR